MGVFPTETARIVASQALEGGRGKEAFYSTCHEVTAEQVIRWYAMRWSVEVTFRDSKQCLGFEEPQGWSRKAVERTAPLVHASPHARGSLVRQKGPFAPAAARAPLRSRRGRSVVQRHAAHAPAGNRGAARSSAEADRPGFQKTGPTPRTCRCDGGLSSAPSRHRLQARLLHAVREGVTMPREPA